MSRGGLFSVYHAMRIATRAPLMVGTSDPKPARGTARESAKPATDEIDFYGQGEPTFTPADLAVYAIGAVFLAISATVRKIRTLSDTWEAHKAATRRDRAVRQARAALPQPRTGPPVRPRTMGSDNDRQWEAWAREYNATHISTARVFRSDYRGV